MVQEVLRMLGPWSWIVFGLLLLGLEVIAPGTFFLWFALSALFVGVITLIVGTDSLVWVWQAQWIVFLVLSVVSAVIGRRMMVQRGWDKSDNPDLNDRGGQLVGEVATLSEPIVNGHGRARIGDTTWQVTGDDMPKGAKVRVASSDGSVLRVQKA